MISSSDIYFSRVNFIYCFKHCLRFYFLFESAQQLNILITRKCIVSLRRRDSVIFKKTCKKPVVHHQKVIKVFKYFGPVIPVALNFTALGLCKAPVTNEVEHFYKLLIINKT